MRSAGSVAPEAGLERLAALIERYWALVIEPHWPRLRVLLEADVLHRSRLLAAGGAAKLLDDLAPTVTWDDGVLTVDHLHVSASHRLGGRGLVLAPSIFVWPRVFSKAHPPWQPVLRYPPRGIATLWDRGEVTASGALVAVLGRSRARLLTELAAPASVSELVRRTRLSSGRVAGHLTVLREAGLVSAYHDGPEVLYSRTGTAEDLTATSR